MAMLSAERAHGRAQANRELAVVFEGSGKLEIPIDQYLWPQKPISIYTFVLLPAHERYIRRYQHLAWIDRAHTEAFWQCRSCGWKPWPVPVMFCGSQYVRDGKPVWDDRTWNWFSSLHWQTRSMLVRESGVIRRFEREVQRKKPFDAGAKVGSSWQ